MSENEKKKRVKIVTFHNAHNYGAVLQCYALKRTIEHNLRYKCAVCDIVNNNIQNLYKPKVIGKTKNLNSIIKSFLQYPFACKKYFAFTNFINKFLLKEDSCSTQYTDTYVCGSDQIWNYKATGFDKRYFLDFVKNPREKNSYSASFGFAQIPDEYIDEYKELLSSFNKISVRESQGAAIIKNLLDIDVPVTLDPTMLLDKSEWMKIASEKKIAKEYILMYLMNENVSITNFAIELKKKTGLDIIYINNKMIGRNKEIGYKSFIGPQEWVSLFLNAKYVVTNSFHGTAFSINFNKDFFVELLPPPSNVNSRLENIVKLFNLEDRMIINGENKNINKSIDYKKVSEILKAERKKSLEFLRSIVEDYDE